MSGFEPNMAQLPITEIYRIRINNIEDSSWNFDQILLLSGNNPGAYNNQVYPLSADHFLATVQLRGSDQTDIYEFDLDESSIRNLSNSAHSEYSPRLHPQIKDLITVVRVPEADTITQSLVGINRINQKKPIDLLSHHGKIGYYRFFSEKKWVCFIVDESNLLAFCNEDNEVRKVFASHIGRSFEVKNGMIYFVHKILDSKWILKKYDPITERAEILADMPSGTEDFYLTNTNQIICGNGQTFFLLNPAEHRWVKTLSLPYPQIKQINRIAGFGDYLFFVNVLE